MSEKYHVLVEHYLACTELHEDNTKHAHVLLWLTGKVNIRDADFADLSFGSESFHGNYQSVKRMNECVSYVVKDGDFITNDPGRITNILERRKRITDSIATSLMNGQTLISLTQGNPGMVMMHLSRFRQFQTWFATQNFISLPLPQVQLNPSYQEARVQRWLALNMWDPRNLRQTQLFIQGTPGSGKTTLLSILEKTFKTFKPCYEVQWWDGFDDTIELICIDEFKGQIKASFMNMILDGSNMTVPRRGGDFQKTRNLPVIICSNFSPSECYTRGEYVSAFTSRVKHICFNSFFNIFK